MNVNDFHQTVQQRSCWWLKDIIDARGGYTERDVMHVVTRTANSVLIENQMNRMFWTRQYKNRLFVYKIETRRAVLELGCEAVRRDRERFVNGFVLHLFGGVYNNRVRKDLNDYSSYTN
jgi:hypothetical protein